MSIIQIHPERSVNHKRKCGRFWSDQTLIGESIVTINVTYCSYRLHRKVKLGIIFG